MLILLSFIISLFLCHVCCNLILNSCSLLLQCITSNKHPRVCKDADVCQTEFEGNVSTMKHNISRIVLFDVMMQP